MPTCPHDHIHDDKHAMFCETGRTYCLCLIPQPENCDHLAHTITYAGGETECMECGGTW